MEGLATLFGWQKPDSAEGVRVGVKPRLCGEQGASSTEISNGLVKWNTQREEKDVWEVSNLRSARSLDKQAQCSDERKGRVIVGDRINSLFVASQTMLTPT